LRFTQTLIPPFSAFSLHYPPKGGLPVRDDTEYELAQKVSDEDFATIKLVEIAPFASWNYRILPR
jgi:hypothetical protein